MCNLWQENYSDLACERHCPGKFDDNFKNYINEIVENINNNLNYQEKPFTEQGAMTVEEIKHHIEKLSKGKAPGPDFLTTEHLIYSGHILIEKTMSSF